MNTEMDFDEFAPWLVLILTILGGALRVLLLDQKGLWLDETFSIWLSGHNVAGILQWVVQIDQHPPLYYLLLHYWMALGGDAPYHVRFLSVIFGTAAIPLMYLIGKRISGALMGSAAAALMAFSLFHIYYAQEARMYTLLTFNAAVAIYALVRLLTDPRSAQPIGGQFRDYLRIWRNPGPVETGSSNDFSYKVVTRGQTGWRAWIARHRWLPIQAIETDLTWLVFILFSALTLFTHNTAVLLLLAANSFVFGWLVLQRTKKPGDLPAFQPPSFANWVWSQLAIFILWLPWLTSFIKQASGVYQRFWIAKPTWDTVLQTLRSFLVTPEPIQTNIAAILWTLYALVFCLGVLHFRKNLARFFFLFTLFAIPFLGELIVSIWRPIFGDRTLIWITIPLFLALAAGIAQMRYRFLMFFVLGGVGTLTLLFASDYFKYYQKEDWSSAAGSVAAFAKKDDLVLFNSNFVEVAFNYYFTPAEEYRYLEVEKRGLPQDLFENRILEPEMTEQDVPALLALMNGHNRVWLVYSHETYTDPNGIIPRTLSSRMTLAKTDPFNGGVVQLYTTP
jgi:mannosyltransferase